MSMIRATMYLWLYMWMYNVCMCVSAALSPEEFITLWLPLGSCSSLWSFCRERGKAWRASRRHSLSWAIIAFHGGMWPELGKQPSANMFACTFHIYIWVLSKCRKQFILGPGNTCFLGNEVVLDWCFVKDSHLCFCKTKEHLGWSFYPITNLNLLSLKVR